MVPVHSGDEITVADDRRVTRLGRLLRLAKLDELPQLWNILAGDMSFVGPRPLVESTVNRFRDDFEWILAESRPGVTDPASIKYRHESAILGACAQPVDYYFRVIMPDKIRMQKAYLRRQSVLGDVKILWQTLAACCRLEQASGGRESRPCRRRTSCAPALSASGRSRWRSPPCPSFPSTSPSAPRPAAGRWTPAEVSPAHWPFRPASRRAGAPSNILRLPPVAALVQLRSKPALVSVNLFTLAAKDSSPPAAQPEVPQSPLCIEACNVRHWLVRSPRRPCGESAPCHPERRTNGNQRRCCAALQHGFFQAISRCRRSPPPRAWPS